MKTDHFKPLVLPAGRYCNPEPVTGFLDTNPLYEAKPLYPQLPTNQHLLQATFTNLQTLKQNHEGVYTGALIYQLPYDRTKPLSISDYRIVSQAIPLETLLITYYLIPKNQIKAANLEFTIKGDQIPPIEAAISRYHEPALFSNFGFFATPQLIYNDLPSSTAWAHNKRYPSQFHITTPHLSPYLGFYYVNHNGKIYSTFQDCPRGMVSITHQNIPQIIPPTKFTQYTITFPDHSTHVVTQHNQFTNLAPITLYTPDLSTPKIQELQARSEKTYCSTDQVQSYSEIITNDRINLFITNIGSGTHPVEHILQVWENAFPITTFGAILSIDKNYFNQHFGSLEIFKQQLNQPITIIPQGHFDFSPYKQIYAASIPLIQDYQNLLLNKSLEEIIQTYHSMGNYTSPNLQLALESKNFCPVVREPSNMIIETKDYFGNLIFSGRYELSLSACSLDQTYILESLNQQQLLPQPIKHALLLDGGSGAKVIYAHHNQPLPLNICAASSRVEFGNPSGNYYSAFIIQLQ